MDIHKILRLACLIFLYRFCYEVMNLTKINVLNIESNGIVLWTKTYNLFKKLKQLSECYVFGIKL